MKKKIILGTGATIIVAAIVAIILFFPSVITNSYKLDQENHYGIVIADTEIAIELKDGWKEDAGYYFVANDNYSIVSSKESNIISHSGSYKITIKDKTYKVSGDQILNAIYQIN